MSVVSATGTVRIVRPRRVVRSGEGRWTLLLIGVVAAVLLLWEAVVSWFQWIPAAFLPAPSAIAAVAASSFFIVVVSRVGTQGSPPTVASPLEKKSPPARG